MCYNLHGVYMKDIDIVLNNLSKSKFRGSFHLNNKMKEYVKDKGIDVIRKHTYDIINTRLKPRFISNDGKQTPMKQVHPTFIGQHATATCCRGCLEKWYHIPKGKELTKEEIDYIVSLIIKWIQKEIK